MALSTIVRISAVGSLLVASYVCGICTHLSRADTQDGANGVTETAPPRLAQKTKTLDLGGGVTFIEVTGESKDGEVLLRFNLVRRDGRFLMTTSWDKIPPVTGGKGRRETLCRTLYNDGQTLATEVDQDGDGLIDLLALLDKQGLPSQAFDVKKDGKLVPVGEERLARMRAGAKLTDEAMSPIADGAKNGVDEREMRKRIEGAVKKARQGRQVSK
ncbi:MAG: hypothetical protein ABFC96_11495 [Thermoguttaceae bacterium]